MACFTTAIGIPTLSILKYRSYFGSFLSDGLPLVSGAVAASLSGTDGSTGGATYVEIGAGAEPVCFCCLLRSSAAPSPLPEDVS